MKTKFFYVFIASLFILASCSKDSDTPEPVVPTTYEFLVDGSSTVAYGGQTTRLMMAKELTDALKNGTHDLAALQQMWTTGTGFSGDLDNPSKILRSKTSASSTASSTVQVQLDDLLVNYSDEVLANWSGDASEGVAGEFTDANRTVHINTKGMEIDQCFAKALIGALCYDQTVNKYCDPAYQAGLNNVDRDPAEDNNATEMEHKWDEGYGYVYGMVAENTTGDLSTDNLLGKYLNKFSTKIPLVFNAFVDGRTAIVENDADTRDNQWTIIKDELAYVIGAKTIGYLEGAAGEIAPDSLGNIPPYGADYFHDLSEGWGFILSLQYTDWYDNGDVNDMLEALEDGNGFWDRSHDELMDMASEIRSRTGIQ